MIKEAIDRVLLLAVPNYKKVGDLEYSDKSLTLITPPLEPKVACSTLQGLVDLFNEGLDDIKAEQILCHVNTPTHVQMISKEADSYGRRRVWADATYPEVKPFEFGRWMDPESFIIACQQAFQRVKVEKAEGGFEHDLDYVLNVASDITAESSVQNVDDGFAQRVVMKQGVALKAEAILKPMVNLAPYRTFAEIDQVLSQFVFRARTQNGTQLAIFEGDGGRWKIGAAEAISNWLSEKLGEKVAVIS